MDRTTPIWKQRIIWTGLVGLAALAFWLVGLAAGWRAWILGIDGGIVAKAQQFGVDAFIWWIPATILTLTAVVMALGVAVVRHLVGGGGGVPTLPTKETLPEQEPLPDESASPELEPAPVLQELSDGEHEPVGESVDAADTEDADTADRERGV